MRRCDVAAAGALIAILPADRLPERVRDALPHVGPAVLGALIASGLAQDVRLHGLSATPLALLAAGLVAWRVPGPRRPDGRGPPRDARRGPPPHLMMLDFLAQTSLGLRRSY